jgi:hypothetical protein
MSPTLRLRPSLLLHKTKNQPTLSLTLLIFVSLFLISLQTVAQQIPPTDSEPQSHDAIASANPPSAVTKITVPAGARMALVLMHPLQSRYIHRGDEIYAQTVSPVVAGDQVVIPPGTFVQGKVDKLSRSGGRAELHLQSMSITFPDGYVAPIAGPMTLESGDGYAIKDPGKGRTVGAFALPAAGVGFGALIGHSMASSQGTTITSTLPPGCTGQSPFCLTSSVTGPPDTGKDTAIGAAIGGAAGAVASIALLFNTHNFFLDVGSPVDVVLQNSFSLEPDQVAEAMRDAKEHPVPPAPVASRPRVQTPDNNSSGICYTPGTPGTPGIDIPGSPAVGDFPGTPGTHIPGTPGTPPIAHPCP